ncbi:predicted protein [Lichtheimia corymbifera JMRC:FSU:9682]|uniref:Uncharacterized protein n=1 Tax=Lichtheimia corymbifera JMRC:FSU:9682 TaxID=1263082 RepID=A0A068SG67_9FUNG|nr:predicted protein [Lichtheimia corymbifera JMRC:FSU:9682]
MSLLQCYACSDITRIIYGNDAFRLCKGRLFIGDKSLLSGTQLRRAFTSTVQRILGYDLTFNDYRHSAVAFGRIHIMLNEEKDNRNAAFDHQAGHSTKTAAMEYGRSNFDHSVLDAVSADRYYHCSKEWQKLLDSNDFNILMSPPSLRDFLPTIFNVRIELAKKKATTVTTQADSNAEGNTISKRHSPGR